MTTVDIDNVVAAAGKLNDIASPLESYDFKETNATGESFGHVELAEWFAAACEYNDEEGKRLYQNTTGLATKLNEAADLYRETDLEAADDQLLEDWGLVEEEG